MQRLNSEVNSILLNYESFSLMRSGRKIGKQVSGHKVVFS